MTTVGIIKVIFFVLVISISALSWLFKKLAEQRQAKQVREGRERGVEHMLRTGRTESDPAHAGAHPASAEPAVFASTTAPGRGGAPPTSHADARRRLQELAERRARQLDELRRRQGQGSSAPLAPSLPIPPPIRLPTQRTVTIGPVGPVYVPPALPTQPPRPRPTPRPDRTFPAHAEQARRGPRPAATPKPRKEPEQAKRHGDSLLKAAAAESATASLTDIYSTRTEAQAAAPAKAAASAMRGVLAGLRTGEMTVGDWRRVFMMREILDKPLSDREI